MTIRIDIKNTPGRLTMIARGKSAESGVAEVYVHGAANAAKAGYLADLGHDPLSTPPEVRAMAREMAKVGVRSLDPERAKRTLTAAAQYTAKWLRDRITSGQLGRLANSTFWKKVWLIRMGRASSTYGIPGPYGYLTGKLLYSIKARWRPGRG